MKRSVLSGVIIDLDKEGKTTQIERILINDDNPFQDKPRLNKCLKVIVH